MRSEFTPTHTECDHSESACRSACCPLWGHWPSGQSGDRVTLPGQEVARARACAGPLICINLLLRENGTKVRTRDVDLLVLGHTANRCQSSYHSTICLSIGNLSAYTP